MVIRTPEPCGNLRLRGLSRDKLAAYFEDLHTLIRGENLGPQHIFNMDETGLQFCHRPKKAVARKGTKRLYQRTSDSKEKVTVVACIRADGHALPPMCIVRGKTQVSVESFDVHLGPANCVWTWQEKGWIENSLGVEWFKNVFLPNCGPERPLLLLLDSHSSHEVLEVLELAKEQNIHIMALPPHTTQRLQPLDTNIFMPFKAKYNEACNIFINENPNKVIDKHSFPLMLNKAWIVFGSADMIQKSFRTTGIYPCNPGAISEDAFTPANALSRPFLSPDAPPSASDAQLSESSERLNQNVAAEDPSRLLVAPDTQTSESSQDGPSSYSSVLVEEVSPVINFLDAQPSGSNEQSARDLPDSLTMFPIEEEPTNLAVGQDLLSSAMLLSGINCDSPNSPDDLSPPTTSTDLGVETRADWNFAIAEIFSTPTPEPRNASRGRGRAITSHRLLTREDILEAKRQKAGEKKKKENEKKMRLEKKKSTPGKGPQPKRRKK